MDARGLSVTEWSLPSVSVTSPERIFGNMLSIAKRHSSLGAMEHSRDNLATSSEISGLRNARNNLVCMGSIVIRMNPFVKKVSDFGFTLITHHLSSV